MRIGFLTCDLTEQHGWGNYTVNLIQALQTLGIEMSIVSANNSADFGNLIPHKLLPRVAPREPLVLLKQLQKSSATGKLLQDCDIIHATIEPYAPVGAWVSGDRPFIVTAHGSYVDLLPRRRWPAGYVYGRALRKAHLLCVSSYTARVARQALPGVETAVIPNGVDPARFASLPANGVEKNGPTVLSVGAVKLRKGTLELVRAMAKVRASMPGVQCVIIGSLEVMPGYTEQVKAEINLLGLEDTVHLLGHVPQETLMAWYGAADVFVLPSMNAGRAFEGYGLTYMEASAAGLPVIGTTDCGAEDAIVDGVTGLLVPQSDVTASLPDAIMALLTDPQRAAHMGAAGRERAQQQTWTHVARKVAALYEQALT